MTMDKIQIFHQAHVATSDQALADFLNQPGCRGDVLLLSANPQGGGAAETPLGLTQDLLIANERLKLEVQILHFDFNSLSVSVDVPPGRSGAWLSYSDVWNAGWTATVNQKPVPVERAFLAYKAVQLVSAERKCGSARGLAL